MSKPMEVRRWLHDELPTRCFDVEAFYDRVEQCRHQLRKEGTEVDQTLPRLLLVLYKLAIYALQPWDLLTQDIRDSFSEDSALIHRHDPALFPRLRLSGRIHLLKDGDMELDEQDVKIMETHGLPDAILMDKSPERVAGEQRRWKEAAQYGHLDLIGLRQNSVVVPNLKELDLRCPPDDEP